MQARPGPYRQVRDSELRSIFFLIPMVGKSFWFVPSFMMTTTPPPGTDKPIVTQILREMLYVLATPSITEQLHATITRELSHRDDIAIKAKLLSLIGQIRKKPWAFPACLGTRHCRNFYHQLKSIVDASGVAADFMGDPFSTSAATGGASAAAARARPVTGANIIGGAAYGGMLISMTNFFASKSEGYYEAYMKGISDELALRGISPSSL